MVPITRFESRRPGAGVNASRSRPPFRTRSKAETRSDEQHSAVPNAPRRNSTHRGAPSHARRVRSPAQELSTAPGQDRADSPVPPSRRDYKIVPALAATRFPGGLALNISIVTDEISSDLETALEIARSWGISAVELRGIGAERYPAVSDYWHLRLPELLDEFGCQVVAISPGLFQTPPPGRAAPSMSFSLRVDTNQVGQFLEGEAQREHHIQQLLPTSIEAAKRLGASTIICFSFARMDHTEGEFASEEVVQMMPLCRG